MKRLIDRQKVRIDNHQRGNGRPNEWTDDPRTDIHLHKETSHGKKEKVDVIIPLNSDRPIRVVNNRNQEVENIPGWLREEIHNALDDMERRRQFCRDINETLRIDWNLDDEETRGQVCDRVCNAFGISTEDPVKTIQLLLDKHVSKYYQVYRDNNKLYYALLEENSITVAQNFGQAKLPYKIENDNHK